MHEFLVAALGFPAALFTFALLVVAAYWGVVLLGGLGVDALDGGEGVDTHGGSLSDLGLGGVPATVAVSLMVAIAWFVSLAGSAFTTGNLSRTAVLVAAIASSWTGTRALLKPLARLWPHERPTRRHDLVGRLCVVRTGRVDAVFGQAEVTCDDGSTALVQVRSLTDEPDLTYGHSALIFDYDPERDHFLVSPFDPALLGC